ncbi:MAG TPA: hypothetical protein PLE75_03405 [Ferruginibacter sp.]|nr:hypothetical protein [Ferruginibacter sp.]HRO05707.1 hypothetical protein [Ferruginibacter sp.]HRO95878.1 hypothetical protein [Ferruginibacter sp.]HRP49113.1 hypothetical protein [Ferruginibacter sp.]
MKWISLLISSCLLSMLSWGQTHTFTPERCAGIWAGELYIYTEGEVKQPIPVEFTVEALSDSTWRWRMEYLSKQAPGLKDYVLIKEHHAPHLYRIDEGNGIHLPATVAGNRMYSVFTMDKIILTSVYTLRNNELEFEVTVSKEQDVTPELTYYALITVQRAILKKKEK